MLDIDPVIVRASGATVFALLPMLDGDEFGDTCLRYDLGFTHSKADYDHAIQNSKAADDEESESILAELRRVGYSPVRVDSASGAMHDHRVANATGWVSNLTAGIPID